MPSARTTEECLALLNLERPKLAGKTQAEVDAKLGEWKGGLLKAAYRAKACEVHPDKHGGDAAACEEFRAVKEAYEQLRDLRVELRKPENRCPSGHERIPEGAKYCHECGYCFVEDPLVTRLRGAGITEQTISRLRASGEFDRLRAMPPLSRELQNEMTLLYHRQRLGLFGPYSGWR